MGRRIPKKIIEERIVEHEAQVFADKIREESNKIAGVSLAKRQEMFKKNEEKSV